MQSWTASIHVSCFSLKFCNNDNDNDNDINNNNNNNKHLNYIIASIMSGGKTAIEKLIKFEDIQNEILTSEGFEVIHHNQ